jgi:signal transduction histidine kinase
MIALIRGGVERQEKLSRKLIRYFELEHLKDAPRPAGSFRCRADVATLEGTMRATVGTQRENDFEVRCLPGCVALPERFLVDAVGELAGNALRFSAPGQKVLVTGNVDGSLYRITVTDQGPGMSAGERAAVAPFTQFGRAKREQQGLGLGLAIARSACLLAGGKMTLQDGPGGRGLSVVLDLPSG